MTLAQIILMAVVPVSALVMLGFTHWHARRNPPVRRPAPAESRPTQARGETSLGRSLLEAQAGTGNTYVGPLSEFAGGGVMPAHPRFFGGNVVIASAEDLTIGFKRAMQPKGHRSKHKFAKIS